MAQLSLATLVVVILNKTFVDQNNAYNLRIQLRGYQGVTLEFLDRFYPKWHQANGIHS